jgi:hypothetical protein
MGAEAQCGIRDAVGGGNGACETVPREPCRGDGTHGLRAFNDRRATGGEGNKPWAACIKFVVLCCRGCTDGGRMIERCKEPVRTRAQGFSPTPSSKGFHKFGGWNFETVLQYWRARRGNAPVVGCAHGKTASCPLRCSVVHASPRTHAWAERDSGRSRATYSLVPSSFGPNCCYVNRNSAGRSDLKIQSPACHLERRRPISLKTPAPFDEAPRGTSERPVVEFCGRAGRPKNES